ncbi:hypothetical protein [Nocardia blacklockiae]|uniref:hypothetical protein n=1 Tax=Nocardia blacklockiae TaxID=480036 RepID=UPI00189357E6|nr:hypothetical protein [Nocardia blacklockiae]MBF6175754.1 hypothetical protein [Nocardia blacklockiae]
MTASKFAAAALLAVGATAVTASVVHAAPAPEATAAGIAVRATDHGVAYTTAPTADRRGVQTTVESGRFVAADATTVALTDAAGNTVATVPLGLRTAGGTVALAAQIGADGRTLTLTPQTASAPTAQAIDEAADTLARKQYNAGIGALIGAGIGAVLGFFLGGVGALITIPVGAGIGALIGYSTP